MSPLPTRPFLTVCCVVKNESEILRASLKSICSIADEIIIIDNNSDDNTALIAAEFTDKIYIETATYHAAHIRNACDNHATGEYIMRWDADWLLQDDSIQRLEELKRHNFFGKDLVYFKWNSELDEFGTALKSQPHYFVYKKNVFEWKYPIHNKLVTLNSSYQPTILRDYKVVIDHIKKSAMHHNRAFQSYTLLKQAMIEYTSNVDTVYLLPFFIIITLYLKIFDETEEAANRLESFWVDLEVETKILIIESKVALYIQTQKINQAQEVLNKANRDSAIQNDPRIDILLGDVSIFDNLEISAHYYQSALTKFKQFGHIQKLNLQRYLHHPQHMLDQLGNL